MTKGKRRLLFYALAGVFFAATPILILYALGFIPNITSRSFTKTGGIFVKSKTTGLKIFLNGEFKKDTSFISGGAIITDLLPGTYLLRIEKENHNSWYKSAKVLPQEVEEFRNILILPQKIVQEKLFPKGSRIISISPDGQDALIEKNGPESNQLFIAELSSGALRPILQSSPFKVSKSVWSKDGQKLLLKRDNGVTSSWVVVSKNQTGGWVETKIDNNLKKGLLTEADFSPDGEEIIFLDSSGQLLKTALATTTKIRDNVNSFGVSEKEIIFVDKNGFLTSINPSTDEVSIISRPGFFLSPASARISFSSQGDFFVLDSSGGLFFVSRKNDGFIKTLEGGVLGAEFNANGDKLIFWGPNEVKMLWIKPNSYQPFQKELTEEEIFKADGGIKEAAWFTKDNAHVFLRSGNGIYITEIDGRGGRNTIELISKKVDAMFWSDKLNKLIFSSNDGIESINL